MRIDVVTIFPDYLAPLDVSLLGKARERGVIDVHVHDLRSWTDDALVDALVATAGNDQPRLPRQLHRERLGERNPARSGDDDDGTGVPVGGVVQDLVEGGAPGLGSHHHPGAAAVGGVVDRVVTVGGPAAQVVDVQVQEPARAGLAGQ